MATLFPMPYNYEYCVGCSVPKGLNSHFYKSILLKKLTEQTCLLRTVPF